MDDRFYRREKKSGVVRLGRPGEDRPLRAVLLLLFLCSSALSVPLDVPPSADDPQHRTALRWGVFAYLGEEETRAQYQPIVDYLNRVLRMNESNWWWVSQEEFNRRIGDNSLDLLTTNPTHFSFVRKQHPLTGVIATRSVCTMGNRCIISGASFLRGLPVPISIGWRIFAAKA
jgi:hypothetical protein